MCSPPVTITNIQTGTEISVILPREDPQMNHFPAPYSDPSSRDALAPSMKVLSNMILDRTEEYDSGPLVFRYRQKQFPHNPEYRESQIRWAANRVVSGAMEARISIHKVMCRHKAHQMPLSQDWSE
jgi:hypothetical protein